LTDWVDEQHEVARPDLATTFMHRWLAFGTGLSAAVVSPQGWLTAGTFKGFRVWMLSTLRWQIAARLGAGAFETISGEVVNPLLLVASHAGLETTSFWGLDIPEGTSASQKAVFLRAEELHACDRSRERSKPRTRQSRLSRHIFA
jgi:hypothetical protein